MRALAAALLCLLTGWALVCLGWPKHTSLREQLLLKFSLSLGCGLGIFSLIFFLNLILAGSGTVLLATDVAVAGLLSGILFFRFRGSTTGPKPIYTRKQPARLTRILFFTLLIAFLSSMYGLVQRLLGNPHGEGWDAFAIWNLHARFLFLGRDYWKEGFTNLIPWSHPDYPLLLPASIAHFWTYLGRDSVAVPAVIALAFTISTLAILVSALLQFRGKDSACLAGIVLLGTPFFLQQVFRNMQMLRSVISFSPPLFSSGSTRPREARNSWRWLVQWRDSLPGRRTKVSCSPVRSWSHWQPSVVDSRDSEGVCAR